MKSDIRLTDAAVVVDGWLGVGTDHPDRPIQATGEIHSSGPSAGFQFDSRSPGPGNAGSLWVAYADRGVARLWSYGDWMSLSPNGTLSSYNYVIGSHPAVRGVDVEKGVHVRGGNGGYSFADRALPVSEYAAKPEKGERWEWYGDKGKARLWSGTDKLEVSTDGDLAIDGNLTVGGFEIGKARRIVIHTGLLKSRRQGTSAFPIPVPETADLVGMVFDLKAKIAELEDRLKKLEAN